MACVCVCVLCDKSFSVDVPTRRVMASPLMCVPFHVRSNWNLVEQ